MSLSAGHKLAHYEILEPIGQGGMGEVYKATDLKLGREVAIKVLPEEFARNAERVARFEREAKILASLNHPNIATIYGLADTDGQKALALELVEGPTLAERIQAGPISVEETLDIAKQIARALEAGHEAGVIHRDVKPANIKVKENGTVKLLDFGLAKALEGETPVGMEFALSDSPTLTHHGTQVGVILGTTAYMSPEQARGKRVDHRTDIWGFGAVVYEMLTRKRAFAGEDVSDTLAAVIRAEPDLAALPAETPVSLRLVVRICLTSEATERFQSMGDVRLALDGAFETSATTQAHAARPLGRRPSIPVALTGALAIGAVTGVAVWNRMRTAHTPRPVARFSLPLSRGEILTGTDRHVMDVSSDGRRLVYSANDSLYIREIDSLETTPLRGTDGALDPFFSPDGEWVGFFSLIDGQLKKVAISGGAAVSLCETREPWGARWEADDTIIFGQRNEVMMVSAAGGTPEVLIRTDATREVVDSPRFLPGERAILFTLGDGGNWDNPQIVVQSLDTGVRKVLVEDGRDARYVPTGHLVYVSNGTLLAVPFDVDKLGVTGVPIPMVEGIGTAGSMSGTAHFSISNTGALVYLAGHDLETRTLVWVDREGREEALAAEPRAYTYPRISPNGARVAIWVNDEESDIWAWDFARETLTRLTFAPGRDSNPVWAPDGRHIAFASDRDGTPNLYWTAADRSGSAERLSESDSQQFPMAFTPDGTQLMFLDIGQNVDLALLSLDGSEEPLLATEFAERNGEISPDGEWLAYQSDETGRFEVYVRPFPNVEDGVWPISQGGGSCPLWSADSRELFYVAPGPQWMTVDIQTEPRFAADNGRTLFDGQYYAPFRHAAIRSRTYDISPDGKRFLMIKESGRDDASSTETIVVVLNWFGELERLVPTN